jgi:hypothetical protein
MLYTGKSTDNLRKLMRPFMLAMTQQFKIDQTPAHQTFSINNYEQVKLLIPQLVLDMQATKIQRYIKKVFLVLQKLNSLVRVVTGSISDKRRKLELAKVREIQQNKILREKQAAQKLL